MKIDTSVRYLVKGDFLLGSEKTIVSTFNIGKNKTEVVYTDKRGNGPYKTVWGSSTTMRVERT